ncbi:hypothetical protein JYT60_01775 [bacterium AH-315-C08]|nr:hypothetical protein [bacterium AH-315-C08]
MKQRYSSITIFFAFAFTLLAGIAMAETNEADKAQESEATTLILESDVIAAKKMCVVSVHASHNKKPLSDEQIVNLAHLCTIGDFHGVLMGLGHDAEKHAEAMHNAEAAVLEAKEIIRMINPN